MTVARSELTFSEVDEIIRQIAERKAEVAKLDHESKLINKEIMRLEGQAVAYLKELGRESYASPLGKVSVVQKWRVNLPQTNEEKTALFSHLKERGIFEAFATVNSNSLNSLYMKDWEEAQKRGEGMTFSMPGVQAPKLFEALSFRKV